MKIIRIIFILLLFPAISIAQQGKAYLGISSGVSVPLGKYSSKVYTEGSFALPGWNVNLQGVYYLFSGLGVGLQTGYYAHPVDVVELANERLRNDPFLEELAIRSDPYTTISMAGFLQYSFALSDKMILSPKVGGGVLYGISPYQLYKPVYYLIGSRWYEITSTRDWSGYFIMGGTFRYRLSFCMDLMVKAEFGYGTLRYRFLTGSGDIREDIHKFMVLDAVAGITVRF